MIETARLIVRPWQDRDRNPWAAMGCDPQVMRFLGPLQSRAESDAAVDRMVAMQAECGHCFWAVERREDGAFLGFCGLKPGKEPIAGETEIGWRLASVYWGMGYAREAAFACLDWAWQHLEKDRVAAITVPANRASWGLMERLGMVRDPAGDFDHPQLEAGNPLRRHITYWAHRSR
ncbi:MAG: GNAT family N-acetyltransferase [Sphingomonas sp.]|jgi:RimJ/RimL family protein N-acetyltransferase